MTSFTTLAGGLARALLAPGESGTLAGVSVLWAQAIALAPRAAFVTALVLGGLLGSALLRRVVTTLVRRFGIETLAESAGVSRLLYAVGAKQGFASFLGSLAFAGGLLATCSAASDALGLTVVRDLTAVALRYAPRLVGAGAILLGTLSLASVAERVVRHALGRRRDVESPEAAAKLAYGFVVLLGAMLAAEQAGIEVGLLITLLEIAAGLTGFAFALTFALGFHAVFRGMAAGHYYRPLLRPGDIIRVGEDEGAVVRFGATAVVLRSERGEAIVPFTRFLTHTVHVRGAADVPDAP
jgi:hypothetical protein